MQKHMESMKAVIANQNDETKYGFLNISQVQTLVMCCVKVNMNF